MKIQKISYLGNGTYDRYEEDDTATIGELFVDQDGVVRFVTFDERQAMEGKGQYSGADGYPVYVSR